MNLITDDKRAFEYNYSHVSEEAKRKLFHLKWLISCQGISEGTTSCGTRSLLRKLTPQQIREKNSKKIHHKEFRFVPSIAAVDESGGD